MPFHCDHCNHDEETESDLDVKHRGCRLKAAFPGAYTEQGHGLVTFDMDKVANSLGMFKDWVINSKGEREHPLEGGLHFRISVFFDEPRVWIEMPVMVGNCLSSWAFHIEDWEQVVQTIAKGLAAADEHIEKRKAQTKKA